MRLAYLVVFVEPTSLPEGRSNVPAWITEDEELK